MSTSYGRPQTRKVNALFDPGQPRAAQAADRQTVNVTSNGRLQDFTSVEIAGANAERGYKELSSFLDQTIETVKPVYEAYLKNEVNKELGLVAGQPEMLDAYRNGDEEAKAWISRFRPQTQYYVNAQSAQAGALAYRERYGAILANDPVIRQSGSTEEQLLGAKSNARAKAWEESGLANIPPQSLSLVSGDIQNTEAGLDARMSTVRDIDAKAVQDSKIVGGLGSTFNLAAQADYLQSRQEVSEENLAANNQQYRDGKTQSWNQLVQGLEASRTSTEAAELIWRGLDEASNAAFGSGENRDVGAGLNILDQGWQLVNNNDVKTANGQILGQVVITQDGRTLRQVVSERRQKLQPLADKAEVDAAIESVVPYFLQLAQVSPSEAMTFLFNNLKDANGETNLALIAKVYGTVNPLLSAGRSPTNEELLRQAEYEVRLRSAQSKAESAGIMSEALNDSGLTVPQRAELAGLAGGGDDETKRLADAEKVTSEKREGYVEALKSVSPDTPDQEIKVQLLSEAQKIQQQKVQDFVESSGGTPPSRDEYVRLYRDSLDEAATVVEKAYGGTGETPLTPGEQIQQELNTASENIQKFAAEGTPTKIREIFSPELRKRAVAAGSPDTYLGVQRFLLNSMGKLRDNDGKPVFINSPTIWQQLRRQAESAAPKPDNTNISAPPGDAPRSIIEMLIPGLKTRGSGEGDQSSAQPANVFSQFLTAVAGGRPAQAGTLEGKPGIDNPDALSELAAVVAGRQNVSLRTPSLPQSPADAPAQAVPAQISTDTHPYFLAIGIAEGTRTPDGGYTKAYYGHSDPGNGRRNVGTISSQQHGNPDVADRVWAGRLSAVATRMTPVLFQMGVKPGTVAFNRLMFNRLDLEVQSPEAAADLFRNLKGDYSIEGIAKARADSFINPATGQLEAGGFGGSYNRLFTDQRSRAGTFDYKRRF